MTDMFDPLFRMTKRRSFGADVPYPGQGLPQELYAGGGGVIEKIGFLGDSVVDSAQVATGALDSITKFADTIRPPEVLGTLPTLPDATYPVGSFVYLTTDGKLYRNVAGSWTSEVDAADLTGHVGIPLSASAPTLPDSTNYPAGSFYFNTSDSHLYKTTDGSNWGLAIDAGDIVANTITAGKIAAGAIGTTELAAGAVTAAKITAGTITTTEIATDTITAGNIAAGAIGASEISSAAVTTDKLAAGAVTAGKITIDNSAPGFPAIWDYDWEWYAAGYTSYWSLSGDWQLGTAGAGTTFVYHARRMHLNGGGSSTTNEMWLGSSAAASVGCLTIHAAQAYYTFTMLHALSYTNGTMRLRVQEYDSSFSTLATTTLGTWTSTQSFPKYVSYRFKTNGTDDPSDGQTIDLTFNSSTRYIRFVWDSNGASTTSDWYICAVNFTDGLVSSLPPRTGYAAASVSLNVGGIMVRNGRILVASDSGSTVVIDGTSNMFKIQASGSLSKSQTAGGSGTSTTTLTGLGTLSTTPAHLSFVSSTNTTGGDRNIGYENTNVAPGGSYVAATSGGSPTLRAGTFYVQCILSTYLSGGYCVAKLSVNNHDTVTNTRYGYYHVLKEAAL